MAADTDIVEHRHGAKQRQVLKRAADADRRHAVGRQGENAAPVEDDVAFPRRVETAEAVEQRGLAGPIRPDQAEQLAGADREGDAVERNDAAEAHADVAYGDERRRRGGHSSLSAPLAKPRKLDSSRRGGHGTSQRPIGATARALPRLVTQVPTLACILLSSLVIWFLSFLLSGR